MMSHFKKILLVFFLAGATCMQAQAEWLTIMGDTDDLTANTIEVDPMAVSLSKNRRVMRVRVSRSADRVSWDGVAYRSYQSHVLFDCTSNTARYLSIDFYLAPGWQGGSYRTSTYHYLPRLMTFRDVEPNPAQRIVRAVCASASVSVTDS